MVRKVVVSFGDGQRFELQVGEKDLAVLSQDDARAWLADGFEAAGCEPSNPMGKLLSGDLLLGVARAAGAEAFAKASPWRTRYAVAALQVREAATLFVDVAAYEVRELA